MRCKTTTPFFSPSKSATVSASSTSILEFAPEGTEAFLVYRILFGSDSLDDFAVDNLTVNEDGTRIGGDFLSLAGGGDGRINAQLLHNFFKVTQLRRPFVIRPGSALKITVLNRDSGSSHTISATIHGRSVPWTKELQDARQPEFFHVQASIGASLAGVTVSAPMAPYDRLLDRFLVHESDAGALTTDMVIGGRKVRRTAYMQQINDEFDRFAVHSPWMLEAHTPLSFEVTNSTGADVLFSALGEVFNTDQKMPGEAPLDAFSGAILIGPAHKQPTATPEAASLAGDRGMLP